MPKKEVSYYKSQTGWNHNLITSVSLHLDLDNVPSIEVVPDEETIQFFIDRFDNENSLSEQALNVLFSGMPNNFTNEEYIYLKVSALNDVYSTHLSSSDKVTVVNVIRQFENRISVNNYDESLVYDICRECNERESNFPYSFVTKYCSHCHEEIYPIYDRYVALMMKWYRDKRLDERFDFNDSLVSSNCVHYDQFRTKLWSFIQCFNLEQFTYKDIDKFLWKAGKTYFPTYVDEDWLPNNS